MCSVICLCVHRIITCVTDLTPKVQYLTPIWLTLTCFPDWILNVDNKGEQRKMTQSQYVFPFGVTGRVSILESFKATCESQTIGWCGWLDASGGGVFIIIKYGGAPQLRLVGHTSCIHVSTAQYLFHLRANLKGVLHANGFVFVFIHLGAVCGQI
jgi:hypothetical protein